MIVKMGLRVCDELEAVVQEYVEEASNNWDWRVKRRKRFFRMSLIVLTVMMKPVMMWMRF